MKCIIGVVSAALAYIGAVYEHSSLAAVVETWTRHYIIAER